MIIVSVVAAVLIVLFVLGAQMVSSISGQSQSYKDGYSAGGSAYSSYGSGGVSAEQACKTAAMRPAADGGIRFGDNSSQWLRGCVAAFNAAQADD